MDIHQMKVFVCVVETGSFSKAAQRLALSQPTVSAHINSLEKELDIRLLNRTTKELSPTAAGRIFFARAREIIRLRDDMLCEIRSAVGNVSGKVSVAVSTAPAKYLLPKMTVLFKEKQPGVEISITETNSRGAVECVENGTAELGLCGTRMRCGNCIFTELTGDRLVLIAPDTPRYRKYLNIGFPAREIEEEQIIFREKGSGTRREAEAFLRDIGIKVQMLSVVAEVDSPEKIRMLVASGKGVSIVSAAEAEKAGDNILQLEFAEQRPRRKLYIVRRKGEELSSPGQAFLDFTLEYCLGLSLVKNAEK